MALNSIQGRLLHDLTFLSMRNDLCTYFYCFANCILHVFWQEINILQWDDIILIYFLFLPVIDIQAFERLLGPCMDIMKRNISQYEDQLVALFGSSVDLNH